MKPKKILGVCLKTTDNATDKALIFCRDTRDNTGVIEYTRRFTRKYIH